LLHPGLIFAIVLVLFLGAILRLRWPLPLALIAASVLAALLGGSGLPFRHLVEGGFGYINLVLALFAGAFFGQMMRRSGAADALAASILTSFARVPSIAIGVVGALRFATGMFTGLGGVAVLAAGVFAAPALARLGFAVHESAAFIALMGTFGMVAPPVNVPAMVIADGVNMPFENFGTALTVLSVPPALFTVWWFARLRPPGALQTGAPERSVWVGIVPLGLVLGFWLALRIFSSHILDPSVPIVLVVGGLAAAPFLARGDWRAILDGTFSGTPLLLAAVLVAIGVAVQIMTLTGIRGWLIINAMSTVPPWTYPVLLAMPLLGGVLISIGSANLLGVPFAFAFIHQDMILNVSALSAVAALAEFTPPTAISAALAGYLVGEARLWRIVRPAIVPLAVLFALAVLMLVFAGPLAPLLTGM
jgi:gluconate:H+ symporter, GntP family